MCLTALKKVAVILLVAVILRYMGICDNVPNAGFFRCVVFGFFLPSPPKDLEKQTGKKRNALSERNQYNVD